MSLFAKYGSFKIELEKYIEQCQETFKQIGDTTSSNLVSGFLKDLDKQRYNITIVGSFNRGKSTLLNTLMERTNDDISPISEDACTSAIIKYFDKDLAPEDKKEKAVVFFNNFEKQPVTIPLSQLRDYVTEEKNPDNRKQVRSVEVYGDFPAWSKAVTIVDSPGQNSVFGHHDTLLCDFLPYTDAIIFLVASDIPLDGGDIALLKELSAEQKDKIFFVLTKVDDIDNPDDLEEVKSFVMGKIAEVGIPCEKLYAVSALPVYQGLQDGLDSDQIETLKHINGLEELEDDLEKFIVTKSDQTAIMLARIEDFVKETTHACTSYIESKESLLAQQEFDINQFNAEEAKLTEENKQLRGNTNKSLIKFEREWKKTISGFSRKFANRAEAIEDKIRDSLDKGGFFDAVFHSFKLKKQVERAIALELDPLLIDMEAKLGEIITALNKDFEDELSLYAKRIQGSDLGSIGGSFVASTAVGGTALWGATYVPAAVTGVSAALDSAATAGWWATITGTASTGAAWAAASAIAPVVAAVIATLIVQKIAGVGLKKWLGTRVPGLMEKLMTEMEDQLFARLDSNKERIIQEYQQNIDDIISDNEERIFEIRRILVDKDTQERVVIKEHIEKAKQLLSDATHLNKQIPLLN